jgi:ferredoxin-NADP reductase
MRMPKPRADEPEIRTESDIPVAPASGPRDLPPLDAIGEPGAYPFTCGGGAKPRSGEHRTGPMRQREMTGDFHALTVRKVVEETSEARSFVLDVPDPLRERFRYRAGQFLSFRVRVGGEALVRCYSMSSSPDVDAELKVTVKRVPGGPVSNWMIDQLAAGDALEVTPPAGRFCLRTDDSRRRRPLVAFSGGSGITPIVSLMKSLLATTERPASLLYANRHRDSIIFRGELEALARSHPDRFRVVHRLDVEQGFVDRSAVFEFVGAERDADFYICGPGPFMDVVEDTLRDFGVGADRIFVERFTLPDAAPAAAPAPGAAEDAVEAKTVTIVLHGVPHALAYHRGETLLETARRGALRAPFSCESGICGTCLARIKGGSATMKSNNVLTPEEVAEGLVLTCQGVPTSETITVEYEE